MGGRGVVRAFLVFVVRGETEGGVQAWVREKREKRSRRGRMRDVLDCGGGGGIFLLCLCFVGWGKGKMSCCVCV